MSTDTTPLRVNTAWANLLHENEQVKKSGKKPMTDEQLKAKMIKLFPDKAEKSTITRVSMVRSCYNKGTNMFKKLGPAGGKGARALSKPYDSRGDEVERAKASTTRKPVAEKAPAAKKIAEKIVTERIAAKKSVVAKKAAKKSAKKAAKDEEVLDG